MFSHFIKIAIRNIIRQKGYSFINIAGLGIGMACAILILLWVQDELSVDQYHENIDTIFRVEEDQFYSEGIFHTNVTPYPSAPVWKDEIPEIIKAARHSFTTESLIKYGDKNFVEEDLMFIDPEYFEMFTVEYIQGSSEEYSKSLYTAMITREIAQKYFGNENPLGKSITINNEYDVNIVAVLEDIPHNSTIKFKIAIPFEIQKKHGHWNENWGSNSIRSYVQLNPNVSISDVNKKMTSIVRRNNENSKTEFVLFPFKDVYLHATGGFTKQMGRIKNVYIFGIIAVFVLLLACINFMNLSTAKSANRAKEIGMRKVIGAVRSGLIKQFYGETLFMAFLGLILSIIFVVLLLGQFNLLTGKEISYWSLISSEFLLSAGIITILTGLIAGTYPALILSRFLPAKVLKGEINAGAKNSKFRSILVILQFSVSIVLIIGTSVLFQQLSFMRDKNLGYDKEHLLYVNLRGNLSEQYDNFKTALRNVPGVLNISGSQTSPGFIYNNSSGGKWEGKDPEQEVLISNSSIDFDFIEAMKIKMADGRSFSKEYSGDLLVDSSKYGNFIINEELQRIMGEGSAIGKSFEFVGVKGIVVGVMKDFHFFEVNRKIAPLAYFIYKPMISNLVIRVAPENISETMEKLESKWKSISPNNPFDYKFLDDRFDTLYRTEERMFGLLKYFAILAIIIACLGLFGLASFTAQQRTKEIGIRKVLGASEISLTTMLCKEFFILVIVSNIIALPTAYFAMNKWLESFAYRITLSEWVFIISGFSALLIALLTVGYQALKASFANPIKSLKYE